MTSENIELQSKKAEEIKAKIEKLETILREETKQIEAGELCTDIVINVIKNEIMVDGFDLMYNRIVAILNDNIIKKMDDLNKELRNL